VEGSNGGAAMRARGGKALSADAVARQSHKFESFSAPQIPTLFLGVFAHFFCQV